MGERKRRDKITIGYFGRFIDPLKGVAVGKKIIDKLLSRNPGLHFLIASPKVKEIMKLKEKFTQQIEYVGFVKYTEMKNLYQKIDLLISTNLYANATLPVIEAMWSSVPVITFDVLDTRKLIKGMIVEGFDVEEFVRKVEMLIKNETLRKRMAKRGKEWVEKNFLNIEEWAKKMVDLIENCYKNWKCGLKV
jgi:glycosyltransferase involved in cell wall biosynthesis